MKFGLFFVMQRPDAVTERFVYDTEIEQMVAADALGFDSIWVAEHHFSAFGSCSAPQVLTAAVAGRTRRIRIGIGVSLLPLHHPVELAEQLAVLDHVSNGRLDVGIGRATGPAEYRGFGIPYEESRARVDEGLAVLRGAWTQETFSYRGAFHTFPPVSVLPKPRQVPHPPLFLASESPDTTEIAARHGLPMMTARLAPFAELAGRRRGYREAAIAGGHNPADVERWVGQTWNNRHVYIADNEKAAIDDPRPHFVEYLAAATRRAQEFPRPGSSSSHGPKAYEDYLREGTVFFGTPEQVVDQIGRFREETGVQNLLCFTAVRAMDPKKVLRSMELFATRVMPHFQD